MDDLKLYGKNDYELDGLLKTVKTFSHDIGITFGLDKCAKATFISKKLKYTSSIVIDTDTKIKELDQEETYKYLGIEEGDGIQHGKMKEKIRKECYSVLQSELNAKNNLKAIKTLAIPVVTYSFNIVNWNLEEIKRIGRKIRKMMALNRMHLTKTDVSRMYIPRKEGGRRMVNLEMAYKATTIGLNSYLPSSGDRMLQAVLQHEKKKKLHSVVKERKFKFQLNMTQEEIDINTKPTKAAKGIKKKAKNAILEDMKKGWREKPLNGKYPLRTANADVDRATTHQWLSSSSLERENDGFILAARDQSISTRAYQSRILNNRADPNYRLCTERQETVDYIVSAFHTIVNTKYLQRHDRVASFIHWTLCKVQK